MPDRELQRETEMRQAIADVYRSLARDRLILHAAGNISARCDADFLITPTGVPADALDAGAMVRMDHEGCVRKGGKPSSEWRFHRDIYAARIDVNAIVHTHSPAATALACQRRALPPFHYMIAVAGGHDVRCADYALFGTQDLSDRVVEALSDRKACLMANHGLIAIGATLAEAMRIAAEIETLCDIYLRSLAAGEPVLLNAAQMNDALAAFKTYGQPVAEACA